MNSSPLSVPETSTGVRSSGHALPTGRSSFTLLRPEADTGADARHDEALLEMAARHGPVASIWQTKRSLVVPRSYRRFETFPSACEHFAAQGWPVTVRQTGGGIVPQGPGVINLSLAYRVQGPPMRHSEAGYLLICRLLADTLLTLGVDAFPAAVEGSFCDGRYNLAVRLQNEAVKIAGTAQSWRRIPGNSDQHVGLVHGLVLLDTDSPALTRAANAFEQAIGSGRRYLAEKVISVAEFLGSSHGLREGFEAALKQQLSTTGLSLDKCGEGS